jgi:ACS family tartrate transporter-like MFS transporter
MDQDQARRSATAKAARRLLPFLCLCYAVNFLDRVNVGFAALAMNQDLGLTPSIFGAGAGIFFIGYLLFEIPSNLALQRFGARIWIARIMISWGLVASAMALVSGTTGFYLMRFLLGVAEAGFFPGIILYLTYWFPARERARIVSLFMAAVPLATVVGGPVSGALLELHGVGGLKGWHWLFIVEGPPVVLLGFVALKFLDDRPQEAAWLSQDERTALASRFRSGGDTGDRLCRSRPRPHQAARADVGAPLFLHRGRAVRHRLLDAPSDPDLWPVAGQHRLSHRHPLSLRQHRHGAVGMAL